MFLLRKKTKNIPLFRSQDALTALNGDVPLLRELCRVLVEDVEVNLNSLKKQWQLNDCEGVLHIVHTMKNSAALIKCEQLQYTCTEMEYKLRKSMGMGQEFPLAITSLQQVEKIAVDTCHALQLWLRQTPGQG